MQQNKYNDLKNYHEPLILSFLESNNDKIQDSINAYADYLYFYITNIVFSGNNLETNLEKVNQAILYRYSMFIGSKNNTIQEIDDMIKNVSLDSIYYAIGLTTYKKRNFKYNGSSSFLFHLKHNVLNVILNEELKKIEFLMNSEHYYDLVSTDSKDNDILLKINKINAPKTIQSKLYNYLTGEIEIDKLNNVDKLFLRKIWDDLI